MTAFLRDVLYYKFYNFSNIVNISKTKPSDYYIVLAKDLSVPELYTMKIAAKSVIWI